MFPKSLLASIALLGSLSVVTGDGNDWVDVDYLIRQQKYPDSDTADARNSLIKTAGTTAKKGPWSGQTPEDELPPSKNRNDYMSFAPYYWADCNWCPSKRGISFDDTERLYSVSSKVPFTQTESTAVPSPLADARRTFEQKRYLENVLEIEIVRPAALPHSSPIPSPNLSVPNKFSSSTATTTTTSSENVVTGTPDPARAHAKTTQSSKCRQSPTTSMPPKATWTSCPYINKDGQANPDTRNMSGPNGINDMSQSVLYNAFSYAITGTRSYSQKAVSFIDVFFLSEDTGLNPNVNYGQIVRGIGEEHQVGTFTGVLDMRGMVKVVNAIIALKGAKSPDWNAKRDEAMKKWMAQYVQWLETSPIANKTSNSANNHATFFYGQLAAVKLLSGDTAGAQNALNHYFSNQFLDHIAESGEQPFEAVRTKPYHYRCFNLEAMITAAKLGDYLGIDFWTAKTKNGATIQKAVDFTMEKDPGSEPIDNIFPHVAAAAAAYGDPGARYTSFLQRHKSKYRSDRFWLYDQTKALKMAPATRQTRRRDIYDQLWRRRSERWAKRDQPDTSSSLGDDLDGATDIQAGGSPKDKSVEIECPAVFDNVKEVELDNGLVVTCDQLKPFYINPG